MKRFGIATLVAVFGLVVGSQPVGVSAAIIDLNSYTLNFVGAGGPANVSAVDQWGLNGTSSASFVGFQDVDNSLNISTGDTFTIYSAISFNSISDFGGNDITPAGFGTSGASTHGITVISQLSGFQNTNNTFIINGITTLNAYFDSGLGYTPPALSNIGTFSDGLLVELSDNANLVSGAGNNFNQTSANGDLSLIFNIIDNLANGDFEIEYLDENGDPVTINLGDLIQGKITINNNTNAFAPAVIAALEAFFGIDMGTHLGAGVFAGDDFDFGFTVNSGGQFNKQLQTFDTPVPEPTSIAIWGLAIGACAAYRRRRMKTAA